MNSTSASSFEIKENDDILKSAEQWTSRKVKVVELFQHFRLVKLIDGLKRYENNFNIIESRSILPRVVCESHLGAALVKPTDSLAAHRREYKQITFSHPPPRNYVKLPSQSLKVSGRC